MRAPALLVCLSLVAGPVLGQEAPAPAPVVTTPPPVQVPPVQTPPAPDQVPQVAPVADPVPEAIDPLGDLIDQTTPQTTDEEEAAPAAPAPHHKPTLLPIPPPEPPAPTPGMAIPQGTYVPAEQVYELRIKGSIAAAQGLQGPLDGGWTVQAADGAALYALQLVDPASGNGPLEGAWRDVRRPGSVGSTGLVETIERTGDAVIVRFSPRVGQSTVLTLNPTGEMRWSGDLLEDGVSRAVTAQQQAPPSLPPGYVVRTRGPVVWPPRAAAAPSRPAAKPVCSTKGKTGKALKAAKARCAALAKKSGKGKAVAKGKKGSKAKATPARKKAAVKKKTR